MTSEVKKDLLALLEVGHSSFHKFGRLEDEWVFILPILVKRIVSQYSGVATNSRTFQFLWDSQIGSILSLKKIIISVQTQTKLSPLAKIFVLRTLSLHVLANVLASSAKR